VTSTSIRLPAASALFSWAIGLTALAAYLWAFLRISWRVGDEGTIVYGAQRVLEGAIPYRDFTEVMGPGAFYWHALWFSVLGVSWTTSRMALLATALGCASALYYITTRQYRGAFAVVPAAIYSLVTVPLWPAVNHHFDANLCVLLAVAILVGPSSASPARSVISGLLLGIGATIMPQKGAYVAVALVVGSIMDRPAAESVKRTLARALWMVVPFAAIGLGVIGFFWSRGALRDLLNATLVFPATSYHAVNVVPYAFSLREQYLEPWAAIFLTLCPWPITEVAAIVVWLPLVIVTVAPALVAVLTIADLASKRLWQLAPSGPSRWSYLLAAFALFASELHRPDLIHLVYGSPLLLVVLTGRLAGLRSRPAALARGVLTSCSVLTAIVLLSPAVGQHQVMNTRRGQVAMAQYDDALEFIQSHVAPGDPVFVYPYYPMYYFLANVRNPTRHSILLYGYNGADEFRDAVQSIESKRVEFVLWDTVVSGENLRRWFPGYSDPAVEDQVLEAYLQSHYRLLDTRNGFRILQRVEPVEAKREAAATAMLR